MKFNSIGILLIALTFTACADGIDTGEAGADGTGDGLDSGEGITTTISDGLKQAAQSQECLKIYNKDKDDSDSDSDSSHKSSSKSYLSESASLAAGAKSARECHDKNSEDDKDSSDKDDKNIMPVCMDSDANSDNLKEYEDHCKSERKVLICKIPPGNAAATHYICVANSAVKAQLKTGSTKGYCKASND